MSLRFWVCHLALTLEKASGIKFHHVGQKPSSRELGAAEDQNILHPCPMKTELSLTEYTISQPSLRSISLQYI